MKLLASESWTGHTLRVKSATQQRNALVLREVGGTTLA